MRGIGHKGLMPYVDVVGSKSRCRTDVVGVMDAMARRDVGGVMDGMAETHPEEAVSSCKRLKCNNLRQGPYNHGNCLLVPFADQIRRLYGDAAA